MERKIKERKGAENRRKKIEREEKSQARELQHSTAVKTPQSGCESKAKSTQLRHLTSDKCAKAI